MKYVLWAVLFFSLCIGTVQAKDIEEKQREQSELFHINSTHTPDHIIGQGGPLVMDTEEKKTVKYSDVDAVNSAIGAVVMSEVHSAMHGSKAKPWMQRTMVSFSFQKDWKPLYAIETVQPIGHYDKQADHVWFVQHRVANAADLGTTANTGIGYRKIDEDDSRYYGMNLFYDHRFKRNHGRFSAGLEYVSGNSSFRMNWYRGTSGERRITSYSVETVSDGYTAEYARTFTHARWARVYMEGYHWEQKSGSDKNGLRVGTELQLTPRISVDMGYNKPEHSGGGGYGKVMFRLAGVDTAWIGGKAHRDEQISVRPYLLERVRRHSTVHVD